MVQCLSKLTDQTDIKMSSVLDAKLWLNNILKDKLST